MVKYLDKKIAEAKRSYVSNPRRGMGSDGYTTRSGAPSSLMIRLEGEKMWRRVMVWQFSNAGTAFVRIKKECFVLREHEIPEIST